MPLTADEISAVALTMIDLDMLIVTAENAPSQPDLIPGREAECVMAELGMPLVKADTEIHAYVAAHRHFLAWHPDDPTGISTHKLATPGWVIGVAEVAGALATLDRTGGKKARVTAEIRCAEWQVELEVWDDWVKLLRRSADSGFPIHIAAPDYEGPWAIAELLLGDQHPAGA